MSRGKRPYYGPGHEDGFSDATMGFLSSLVILLILWATIRDWLGYTTLW
jgi:hypothetical protein